MMYNVHVNCSTLCDAWIRLQSYELTHFSIDCIVVYCVTHDLHDLHDLHVPEHLVY